MPKRPPLHHPAHWKPYEQHKAIADKKRPNANDRGYSARWRKARNRFIAANPLCAECRRQDTITAATVVDHIKPHKGNYKVFWDESNWQSLCTTCHNRKTLKEGAFGR